MSLQIRRLCYNLGAEIIGIDIRKPLDDKIFHEVHSAFLEYCVLLFRGQPLTREQHLAFSRQFGEIEDHGALRHQDPAYRQIMTNMSPPAGGKIWHSDRSFSCTPTMATLLHGIQMPEVGGDTMFSNMYVAYETLSDGMKKLIEGLHAIHPATQSRIDDSTPERLAETMRLNPPVAHPLVRVHPETGRKSIYLGEKVKQLVGLSQEESEPLITFLCQHAVRPQFVYRHRWRNHDLIMWDNRCTNHIAVGDYDRSLVRHTEKTCVVGTPSGYVYAAPQQAGH